MHQRDSSPKKENRRNLLTLKLFQTCMNFFLLLKHKRRYFEEFEQLLSPFDFDSMEKKILWS